MKFANVSPNPTFFEDDEPRHTIYGATWQNAWTRTRRLDPAVRPLFDALLRHVEAGWVHVRRLQCWYEGHQPDPQASAVISELLAFVDGDLVDVYRAVAGESSALVPDAEGWKGEADPHDVEAEAECFRRYLFMFVVTVESVDAPHHLRTMSREIGNALEDWFPRMRALVDAITDQVVRPAERAAW